MNLDSVLVQGRLPSGISLRSRCAGEEKLSGSIKFEEDSEAWAAVPRAHGKLWSSSESSGETGRHGGPYCAGAPASSDAKVVMSDQGPVILALRVEASLKLVA